ncbi:uncharacterized protein LOC142635246 [Castanea sativa]|uniref:uncharacterized protein LOC142635246 n=1 Tax=Castanea sativa TaxID=21020 RepID=UPI003F64D50D
MEYWASKVERVLVRSRHREGYATSNMQLYWRKSLGFTEWCADLNGWVVHGGNVPIEWSGKNTIVGAPKSNPTTGSTKRSHGKSPPLEDRPKKVRRKKASAKKPKIDSPKPPTAVQSDFGAVPVTKSNVPAAASTSTLSFLKQYKRKTSVGRIKVPESSKESGESEETQSKEYDFEDIAADFGKLLFLASVSSCVSSPNVLYSLGPIDEDIEIADEGLDVTVTTKEANAGMPSKRLVVSSTIHDVHQSKEPPELRSESSSATFKRMSLEEFLEQFAKYEENEKVAANFYPFSSNIVMFQWSKILAEGQPLLEVIVRKYPHFMTGCKLGASLRKS